MSVPKPPVPLEDVCSVIFNNTLYTYSPNAFQALPLTKGAKWKKLPQGEKVTGGACVGSTPGDPKMAGFYVVGGKGNTDGYQGLQKYTYSTGKWETVTPDTPVTQNRQSHGAVFLNSSNSILVYAGSQDGAQQASTQTFTVGAEPPYAVSAYQAAVTPAINPILLPWSDTHAAFIGGDAANTKVMLFNPTESWSDSGATLAQPLKKDSTVIKGALVNGDDGSKNLYVFDLTDPADSVKRVVLVDGKGAPVPNAGPVARSEESAGAPEAKRDGTSLTAGDWPEYNSTFAPTTARSKYSLAQDTSGMIVLAGGDDKDPLSMFNGRENRWDDTTAMLVGQSVISDQPSSTSATKPTTQPTGGPIASSTTPSSTSDSAAAAPSGGSGLGTNTVLGISLGSIFGLALILGILYFCLERRRKKNAHLEAGHARRASGASSSEKDGVGLTNDSLPQPPPLFRGHNSHDSQASFSSMAILMGRMKQGNNNNNNNNPDEERDVGLQGKRNSASSVFKAFKSTISKPVARDSTHSAWPRAEDAKGVSFAPDTAEPRPRTRNPNLDPQDSTRRSSGWNRYWSGGSALNILGFGNGNGGAAGNNKRLTIESQRESGSSDRSQYRITQDSATVPHLTVCEPRASFSRVNSGSPTIAHHDSRLKESLSAPIERPVSMLSDGSAYSSGVPASVQEAWDPTQAGKPWGSNDRAPSGAYGTALTPASSGSKQSLQALAPTGMSRQPQLTTASTSSDMSWLNLGDRGNNSHI